MAATSIKLRAGLAPADLGTYPVDVRKMWWQWVMEIALEVKDRELAAGLDRHGEPLKAIAEKTRRYRRSAMTPDGRGDPSAPPLMPARALSRTRSLLAGRSFADGAELYWRFDAWTGESWGKILAIQARKGRDVIGISPDGLRRIRTRAWERWRQWKAGRYQPTAERPRTSPGIPAVGTRDYSKATFGIGAAGPPPAGSRTTGGLTWPEWQRYFRQPARVEIPGRPVQPYNRLLAHVWGQPRGGAPPRSPAPGRVPLRPEPPDYSRKKPRSPGPIGAAISGALETAGHPIRGRLDRALLWIHRVHGTGSIALKRIPVLQEPEPHLRQSTFARTDTSPALPLHIRVYDRSDIAEFALVHEIGHFLERFAIPGHNRGNRPYASDPTLAGWLAAVRSSAAYARLGQLGGPDVDPAHLAYLLRESELWARSYAQYIVLRSRDKTLLRQLELYRARHGVYNDVQWEDADFAPIAAALDRLFQSIGWRG